MNIRRFFKRIHIWLSIPTGIIIFIICITGAILSFETEILEAYYPERYFINDAKGEKLPLDQLIPIINNQLDTNTVASIKITADPNRTYTAGLTKGFRVSAFVDPYTGEVKGIYSFREGFFYKIMTLHRWLMDSTRTWGKYATGITTLLFVFILISGVVWWIPSDKKKLKYRFRIKTKSGAKRFFFDLHTALGIYACIFLLVCSLTGLMWSFEWYRNSVGKLFGVEATADSKRGHGRGEGKEKKKINTHVWQTTFDNIKSKVPSFQHITISDGSATVLDSSAPHLRATDKYTFNNNTGEITKASLFSEQKNMSKIMSWAYALHVGAYGGIITRILTCLACIIGATLPLTGYYIFYKKRKKNKTKSQYRSHLVS